MAQTILSSSRRKRPRLPWMVLAGLALVTLGAAGGWWWESRKREAAETVDARLAAAGIDSKQRVAIEGLVREYILSHPEILPEAMERLQSNGAARAIAAQRAGLETPFPGAVLGNPAGKLTLIQFSDYACGFCRRSVADIAALVAAHPDLRVVIRELPILSPQSEDAARMALAAGRQGRYAAFHDAMFRSGPPDASTIAAAARAAGVDAGAADAIVKGPEISAELARNLELSRALGIQGTPAWVVGDRLLIGALGREALEQAIAEARAKA